MSDTHRKHQEIVISKIALHPKHVAIFHRVQDSAMSLVHYETNRGSAMPDKVHDIWTVWNRGTHFEIVDSKGKVVFDRTPSIGTYNWDMCLQWLTDKAVEINDMNKEQL